MNNLHEVMMKEITSQNLSQTKKCLYAQKDKFLFPKLSVLVFDFWKNFKVIIAICFK